MTHIWQGLRSGRWLTPARIRGYSLILLGICAIAIVGWMAVSDGLIDRNGKPLGTDFSNVYAAGTLTWQGHPSEAYVSAFVVAAFPYAWGLATASLLATLYVLDYDLVALAVAIAFFARHGLNHGFRERHGSCRCCRAASPASPAYRLA